MDYKELVKPYQPEAIKKLQEWIQINSVDDPSTSHVNQPFGKGVNEALKYIGELAKQKGFKVDYCDGYCTEISYGTKGKLIGIFAHADVVPATGEWKHKCFGGEIIDDIMYGRGTSDDKGPAMSAFYALCALKDNGLLEGFRIRLVIGGNEEKGSRCLEHYFKVLHKEYPDYGFTPDGEFPLIYGEKGICNFLVKDTIDLYPIISINAGVAGNAVIDKAECVLAEDSSIDEALKNTTLKYSIEHRKDDMTLIIFGKSAHGSTPELGINAGLLMMEFISNYYDLDELKRLSSLFKEPNGSSMGAYYFSELLHGTTYNVGIIKYNNLNFEMTVNFRYPENVNPHEVIKNIGNMTDPFTTIAMGASAPLLFDPLSPMIRGLLSVYQEESGDLVTPIMTIGGGTYAKESKNTIAFGSAFPNLDCHIHDADEFITLHDFNLSMAIYAHAIIKLGKEL